MNDSAIAVERQPSTGRRLAALSGALRPSNLSNLLGVLGLAALVGVWYLVTLATSSATLPLPQVVAKRIVNTFMSAEEFKAYGLTQTGLGANLLYTAENVFMALGIGTALGMVLGLVSARFDLFRAVLNPIVATATTVPVLVAAPFFLVWFGVGRLSGTLLLTVYSGVIIVIYSQRAAVNLDPVYESNALTLGAGKKRLLLDVLLPATIPEVLGGIRIALAGAWGLEVVAELLGSNSGVGVIIRLLVGQFDAAGIFSAVLAICILAVIVDGVLVLVMKQVLRWRAA